jgi:Ca2+:H+ antiporter
VTRKILTGSLALTPIALAAHYLFHASDTATFVLAALALMPLAWLIGEATEHVGEHTGPGIGGFFNASFGNAPELIIALLAVANGLPEVVRGSIIGSVVSNLLLVLGLTMIAGGRGQVDRRSLFLQLAIVMAATIGFLLPSIPGWNGDPDRHSLYLVTLPVAIAVLTLYIGITVYNLRRHHAEHVTAPSAAATAWSMRTAIVVLAAATVATALVSEMLVGSLEEFGQTMGLSDFFVAIVIVAIVGNAAEHGGAIVVARRGKLKLATEIAVSSAAQVAVFVAPAAALLSFAVGRGLPLTFRPIELAAMAGATMLVAVLVLDGRSQRWKGFALVGVYALAVAAFWMAGDR